MIISTVAQEITITTLDGEDYTYQTPLNLLRAYYGNREWELPDKTAVIASCQYDDDYIYDRDIDDEKTLAELVADIQSYFYSDLEIELL